MNRNRMTAGAAMALVGLAALVVSACGGDDGNAAAAGSASQPGAAGGSDTLRLTLDEWSVIPAEAVLPAGEVTLIAANSGKLPHDLVIVRTDLGPKDLPVADGRADETKLTIPGRFKEFKSGEKEKRFTLEAGSYLLICNIPTHYEQGMVAKLTVR